jgi:hypothetical protein
MASPVQQSRHVRRLGRWLPVIIAAAVVLALAGVLAARAGEAITSRLGTSGGTSSHWRTYYDPFGLFTLRLPPAWTAQNEPGTATTNDSSGSFTVSTENITFENSSQGTGSASLDVSAYRITDTSAHQYYCRNVSDFQSFSPMNLSSTERLEDAGGVWLFTTDTGFFTVDVTIPGIMAVGYVSPSPPPTPLPASWLATDQTEMQVMLTSFQPTDSKPLSC